MARSFSTKELSRALRADVPCVDDELFVTTLAQVAGTAPPAQSRGRGISWGLKVGAVVASIVVTAFGAAQASDLLSAPPKPAIISPSDHGLQTHADPPSHTDTPRRHSERRGGAARGLSSPDSERSGSGLPSPREDRDEEPEPDDRTEPAPLSVADTPSGSGEQDHHSDEHEDGDKSEDGDMPEDGDKPEDNDGHEDGDGHGGDDEPDDTDGADGRGADGGTDERDRADDDSERVDDVEGDD